MQMFNFADVSGGKGGGASNQFFPTLPQLPGTGTQVSTKASSGGGTPGYGVPSSGPGFNVAPGNSPYNPYTLDVGGGYRSGSTLNPNETSSFIGYLMNQMGKGVDPFNLSAKLPGGGTTQPGQLTAGLDPILQQLMQYFQSGGKQGGFPGMQQLGDIATKGINAVPTWQSMTDAMQREIAQGRANLKEQFNVGGNLVGSPYGTAAADYELQSAKDLNSILAQMQFQGIQEQIGAGETIAGMGTDFGKFMEGLDQQTIQNMYQEFIRTRPQYNPMLPYEGQIATTFPAFMGNKVSTNPLAGLIPGAAQGLGAGIGAAVGGAGAGASSVAGLLAMLAAI